MIISAEEAQKEDNDRAQLGGDESEDDGSESNGMVDDDGKLVNEPEVLVRDVEMGERRRLNKRRCTDEDMVSHKLNRILSYMLYILGSNLINFYFTDHTK